MGSKKKSGGGAAPAANPFPYIQPDVYYDPEAGMYYALTGKKVSGKPQRTTNFSMIPILNQSAMSAYQGVGTPTLEEMFPLVSTPDQMSALLSSTMSPQASAGAGRFLGLLGNGTTNE
jgi:hypothetical protein